MPSTPRLRLRGARAVWAAGSIAALALGACTDRGSDSSAAGADVDALAAEYVRIALAFRRFDGDYVDAYFGPADWASAADSRTLSELHAEARALVARIPPERSLDATTATRAAVLRKRIGGMLLRMDMAGGETLPFDRESAVLFDAVAPDHDAGDFAPILARIDMLVPGDGSLPSRLDAYRRRFEIPAGRLEAVMHAAIDECRRRTLEHIALPTEERFTLEFVTDKPWSGYNWYKGEYYSVIQINTDLPIFVDRAVDLGCHEGYPGHHTYNVLIEQRLVRERGWIEFTLNPLYGPQSLLSEGSANFGIEMAFPGSDRREFEKAVIFPLAGLDPALVDTYYDLQDALAELSYAGNEAARDYLNGQIDRESAAAWLVDYTLSQPDRAAQRVRFFDTYRSYVINYNLGRDLVAAYVERRAGSDPERRWDVFEQLLSEPVAAGDLL